MKVIIWEVQKQNDIQKTDKDNVTFVVFTMLNSDLNLIIAFIRIGVCSSLRKILFWTQRVRFKFLSSVSQTWMK